MSNDGVEIDGFLFKLDTENFQPSDFSTVFSQYTDYVSKVSDPKPPAVLIGAILTKLVVKSRRTEFLNRYDHFVEDLMCAFNVWRRGKKLRDATKGAIYIDTDSIIVERPSVERQEK